MLQSDELRQGIKSFSDWPTIPQLYVKGEFVGGSDIVREMFQSGELKPLLVEKGVLTEANAPRRAADQGLTTRTGFAGLDAEFGLAEG